MQAELFENHRPKLFGIAYRMLGTVAEAEDITQEVYLRWHQSDPAAIANFEAFLVTVTTRLCIDHLKSARVQRETYIGTWLPEPLINAPESEPGAQKELADTLSYAFLMLLERLNPVERAVYILREAFDFKHAEIAKVLDRSPDSCRQLSRRAKEHLKLEGKRFESTDKEQERLFTQFLDACGGGNLQQLFDMLADDITLYSDGGGKVLAALRPLQGKDRIIRFFNRLFQQHEQDNEIHLCRVNGQPGLRLSHQGKTDGILTLHFVNGKIQQLFAVRNPDKLCQAENSPSIM